MYATPCHYHDVDTGQLFLTKANGLSDEALEPIALYGKLHVLFADHQTKAGLPLRIPARKRHHTLAVHLEISLLKYVAIVPGIQQT